MSADGRADDEQTGEASRDPGGRAIDRRTLLKGAVLAGGALLGGGVAFGELLHETGGSSAGKLSGARSSSQAGHAGAEGGGRHGAVADGEGSSATNPRGRAPGPYKRQPNILVVMVDQLRTPSWFSDVTFTSALTPHLARLRKDAVSFEGHYTASNDCTPARSTLVTGLYTHQTGCMITGGSTLAPSFPTWGTMLRELGYSTWWYGKWHLTHGDNHWRLPADAGALERYGFGGGTYPSPDGGPGQGWRSDPQIAKQFEQWLKSRGSHEPWCTTVSFVNPHDIAWWYRWSDQYTHEAQAPKIARSLPPNFETAHELELQRKPRLQLSHIETTNISFGNVPDGGPGRDRSWLPFLDLYLKLVRQVDTRIGEVMSALYSRHSIAENTIVVFTSDHGEYGASHGLRGKGGGVYEEGLHVPLLVKDLREEKVTRAHSTPRRGMTSSVDVAPLLVDLATGSSSWRRNSDYGHLAQRHDLLKMLSHPHAPGRDYVLHATDEIVTEYAARLYAADAPLHVTAIRTAKGKLALYSNWSRGGVEPLRQGQEGELYLYDTEAGRRELKNSFGSGGAKEAQLRSKLERAMRLELAERVPQRLHQAYHAGFRDYRDTAADAAVKATERRARMLESLEEGKPLGGGLHTMLRRQRYGYVGRRS
ncbi:MAG: sulfatase-like hydrolase/transferase [Solirubrobacteraceae bacterium]